jgi:carbamoyl-phosphate synthase large subunit
MNILFTCAGRRTYLLKYFKEQLGRDGLIIGADLQMTAPALSAADVAVTVPRVYDEQYVDRLLDICKQYQVDMLISLNDLELPILADAKERFMELGVCAVVSDKHVIDICFDKYVTARFVCSLGLDAPKTYVDLGEAKEALATGELKYPVILKPRWGSGSIGIEVAEDDADLVMMYAMLKKKVKKTILATASVGEEYIMIQQMIQGKEYGLDVMNDLQGNCVAVSVKEKLAMRTGETDKAVTVDLPVVREMGREIGSGLKHIGNLDCDILEQDGHYYVLELNPRFGGGFPFSYEAGVNFPKALIEWAKGNDVDASILQPEYGMTFAKCDVLVKR